MRLRWTAPSVQDLYNITRYIRRDNPTAAREVAKTLYDGCESLIKSPHRGRKGNGPARANWYFLLCPILRFTASRRTPLKSCTSGTPHKAGIRILEKVIYSIESFPRRPVAPEMKIYIAWCTFAFDFPF